MLQAISPFFNVFHRYISLVHQNAVLCPNGLIIIKSNVKQRDRNESCQNDGQQLQKEIDEAEI